MLSLHTTTVVPITPVKSSRRSTKLHSPNARPNLLGLKVPGSTHHYTPWDAELITPPQTHTHTRPAGQDEFGSSLSSSGDTLVVGGVGYNSSAGAAYVFTVSRSGVYQADQRIVHPEQVNRGRIMPSDPSRRRENLEIVQLRRPFATRSSLHVRASHHACNCMRSRDNIDRFVLGGLHVKITRVRFGIPTDGSAH